MKSDEALGWMMCALLGASSVLLLILGVLITVLMLRGEP